MKKLLKKVKEAENTAEYQTERLMVDIGEEMATVLQDKKLKPNEWQALVLLGLPMLQMDMIVRAFWYAGYRVKLTVEPLDAEKGGE